MAYYNDDYADLAPMEQEIARELDYWNPGADPDRIREEAEEMAARGYDEYDAIYRTL